MRGMYVPTKAQRPPYRPYPSTFFRVDHFDDLDNNRPPFLALAQKSAAAAVCLTVWPHTASAAAPKSGDAKYQ